MIFKFSILSKKTASLKNAAHTFYENKFYKELEIKDAKNEKQVNRFRGNSFK